MRTISLAALLLVTIAAGHAEASCLGSFSQYCRDKLYETEETQRQRENAQWHAQMEAAIMEDKMRALENRMRGLETERLMEQSRRIDAETDRAISRMRVDSAPIIGINPLFGR